MDNPIYPEDYIQHLHEWEAAGRPQKSPADQEDALIEMLGNMVESVVNVLMPLIQSVLEALMPIAEEAQTIINATIIKYPKLRKLKHLALHAKSKRARKKNIKRFCEQLVKVGYERIKNH